MPRLPAFPFRYAAVATLALVSACGKDGEQPLRVVVIEGSGVTSSRLLTKAATAEGMVALDAEGKVVPAMAERWTVTDDGASYIFRLRDATWPDGMRLSGESVAGALRQTIAAQRGTALGLDLGVVEEVRAMASRVVEVRLRRPMPDFLQLLAQPELTLMRHGQGTGPMGARPMGKLSWLKLLPPDKRGLPLPDDWAQNVRPVTVVDKPARRAIADLAGGRADVVLGGSFADLALVKGGALSKIQPRVDPVNGLFGLMVERGEGLLEKPALREALAMAIDRSALAGDLGLSGWTPTTRVLVGAEGGERWADYDLDNRRLLASRRIAAWAQAHHATPSLRIALPEGPGADRLAMRLTQDFAAIGVTLVRVGGSAPADLRLFDEVARYGGPVWVFNRLNCAVRQPCSPEGDALAAKALEAPTPEEALALTSEAEREYAKANVYIPLGQPVRYALATGTIAGFSVNRWAYHPLFALANHPR